MLSFAPAVKCLAQMKLLNVTFLTPKAVRPHLSAHKAARSGCNVGFGNLTNFMSSFRELDEHVPKEQE